MRSDRGGSGNITPVTVRHWAERVAEDVGCHTQGGYLYQSLCAESQRDRLSSLTPEQARSAALADLSNWVWNVRP